MAHLITLALWIILPALAWYIPGRIVWQSRDDNDQPDKTYFPDEWENWASRSMIEPWAVTWGLLAQASFPIRQAAGAGWFRLKTLPARLRRARRAHMHPGVSEETLQATEALQTGAVDVAGTTFDLSRRRAIAQAFVAANVGTPEELLAAHREHEHITTQLARHFAQEPGAGSGAEPSLPRFLARVVGSPLAPYVAIGAIAIGLSGWPLAAVNGWRLDHSKHDLKEARAEAASYRLGFTAVKGRLDDAYSRVTSLQAKCVGQLESTAKTADALQRRIVAMKKKRADDEKALVAGGAAVSVGSVLNDIWEGRAAPGPAPADSAPVVPVATGTEAAPNAR